MLIIMGLIIQTDLSVWWDMIAGYDSHDGLPFLYLTHSLTHSRTYRRISWSLSHTHVRTDASVDLTHKHRHRSITLYTHTLIYPYVCMSYTSKQNAHTQTVVRYIYWYIHTHTRIHSCARHSVRPSWPDTLNVSSSACFQTGGKDCRGGMKHLTYPVFPPSPFPLSLTPSHMSLVWKTGLSPEVQYNTWGTPLPVLKTAFTTWLKPWLHGHIH